MAVKQNLDQVGRIAQMVFVELTKYKRHQQKYNERRREATERLRKHLTTVWTALENGETVNGYDTKEKWAKHFFNPTARHPERWIQKIIANKPKTKANSVRPEDRAFLKMLTDAREKAGDIQRAWDAPFKPGEVKDGNEHGKQIDEILEPVYQEFLRLLTPEGYGLSHITKQGTRGGWMLAAKEEEPAHERYIRKRVEATKLTEAGKKKASRLIHQADANKLGRQHAAKLNRKTHQLQPNGRTWCGKTLGDTLKKDAPLSDEPTCKQCQWGKGMDKLRKEHRSMLHPVAKALAATVDGAEIPKNVAPEAVDMVKRFKARAALGLPQGDTRPNEED
jgi:hypothetical protein